MTDAAAPPVAAPAAPPVPTHIPWLGVTAVLLGTFISTLNGRLSSFGLADIRGGVHATFDDGAWITTAQTVAQMLIAPIAVWLGATFGPRRVLLAAASIFAISSIVAPFSVDLPSLLVLQFVCGAPSGCFIPLTLSFVLRDPSAEVLGLRHRALRPEPRAVAQHLGLPGRLLCRSHVLGVDLLATERAAGDRHGPKVPALRGRAARRQPRPSPHVDLVGLASLGLGLALIYAGLRPGQPDSDWQHSGLVWGLACLSGALLVVAFFIHETRTSHPFLDLQGIAFALPQPRQLPLLISFLRLTILSTQLPHPPVPPGGAGASVRWRSARACSGSPGRGSAHLLPLAGLMLRRTDARRRGLASVNVLHRHLLPDGGPWP